MAQLGRLLNSCSTTEDHLPGSLRAQGKQINLNINQRLTGNIWLRPGREKLLIFFVTMKPWKTLSRRSILDHGRFLAVEMHTVELPDGRVLEDWPWIVTPDFVNIVAETDEGRFLCFRQTKYAVVGESLAAVGGFIESGESPEAAARRELLEETGFEAPHWTALGEFAVDANRGSGRACFFLARGARRVCDAVGGDLEEQRLVHLTRAELESALLAGEFKVLPWTCAVALALQRTATTI